MPDSHSGSGAFRKVLPSPAQLFSRALGQLGVEVQEALAMPADEGVHRVRLVIKRLRALLRLLPDSPGPLAHPRWDSTLRRLSHRLAPIRDRCVRESLLRRLLHAKASEWQWLERIQTARALVRSTRLVRNAAAKRLLKWIADLRASHPIVPDFECFRVALRQSWHRTEMHRKEACRTHAMAAFHRWRRWQKRWEFQCCFMAVSPSGKNDSLLRRLHTLQEGIGHLHDADQLLRWLRKQAHSRNTERHPPRSLIRRAEQLRRRLRKRVLRESRSIFTGHLRKALRRRSGPCRCQTAFG